MVVVFAVALGVRLLHLWFLLNSPYATPLLGDARAYDRWAQEIAAGDWVGTGVFYQAPLYPYLLGLLYALFGHSVTLVRLLQTIGGSLACVSVAVAGSRLFSRQAGLTAGLLLAVYPPAIFFDGLVQKTSLDVLLVAITLQLATSLIDQPAMWRRWVILGVTIGALCLSRENALVFVPLVVAWILSQQALMWPRRFALSAAFLAGCALVLSPVAARNYAFGGEFQLTTSQSGPNFFIGNNADATGMYQPLRPGRGTAEFERADATDLAEQDRGAHLTPGEVSRYWIDRGLAFVRQQPGPWGRLMVRKAALFLNAIEIADTESLESHADWSPPLRIAGRVLTMGLLLPLAVLGICATWPRTKAAWLLPVLALAYAATVIVFYVVARYRQPVVPFVALWAAAGLYSLPALVRGPLTPRFGRGAVLATMVLVAGLAHWPLVTHASMRAVTENNLGVALQAEGRTVEAVACFRRVVELEPEDAAARLNLGVALQSIGEGDEALDAFVEAVALRPDLGDGRYFLGKLLAERGRTTDAIAHLRAAVETMPESLEARTALGLSLAVAGQFAEALREFRDVVRRSPSFPNANWNLGSALAGAGRYAEAIPHLEEALRRAPANREALSDLVDARNRRGIELASSGRLAEAIADFEEAVRLDPRSDDARRNLETATALRAPAAPLSHRSEKAIR